MHDRLHLDRVLLPIKRYTFKERTFGREKDAAQREDGRRKEREEVRGSCFALESTERTEEATLHGATEGWVPAARRGRREYPPKNGAFKFAERKRTKILLTVTSIQRAERPGDARPPENRGHVTDPPHPDP